LLANALVGNGQDEATLELTLLGGRYRALVPLALATAGAPMRLLVHAGHGAPREITAPSSFTIEPGAEFQFEAATRGARTYLAVRGGWLAPRILGSRSSEQPLRAGNELAANPGRIPARRPEPENAPDRTRVTVQVLPGPDAARLAADSWLGATYRVSRDSNRVGLRLEGPEIAVDPDPVRLSAPVAPGAIQVAGGQLLVLGVAGGTLGGYPHVAQVVTTDLDLLGQLRPGDEVGFETTSLEAARARARRDREALSSRLLRIRTLASY
jgi:allophanate hydrolase subunit 2